MKPRTRRRLAFVAGFVVYFSVLWTFWDSVLVYPLKIFVVLLHELSHAVAAWATGGQVSHIVLDPRQGGETRTRGGNAFAMLSAGYLGSLLWGVGLVRAAYWKRVRAGTVTGVIGVIVLALTALFVRSAFGVWFGVLFANAMLLFAWRFPDLWNRRIMLVLGMTSCLYAVLDIKSDILDRPTLPSDAAMLAEMTGIPTVVWGVLWIGLAIVVCGLLLKWAWKRA